MQYNQDFFCLFIYSTVSCNIDLDKELFSTERVLGPVVQSIVSLTSSLVVRLLTVLVSILPNSQVFLLKKCE